MVTATCECGFKAQGESRDEVKDKMMAHLEDKHPDKNDVSVDDMIVEE
jgi:predicted small metal-binding protein